MNKIITTSFLLLGLIFSNKQFGQGYEIKVTIKNTKDSSCLLTKYTWEQPYKVDTAIVDKNGNMVFKGKEPLERGIFLR